MTVTFDQVKELVAFVLPLLTMLYTFIATRRKDVDERLAGIEHRLTEGSRRMDRQDGRMQTLEQKIGEMPNAADIHTVQLSLSDQTGALREIRAMMDGNGKVMARLEAIVSRHEDHLLNGGK